MKLRLKLKHDWKTVSTKAWSMRFWAMSVGCQLSEAVLPKLEGIIPDRSFAVLSVFFAIMGIYSRLVVQKDVEDGK